MRTIRGGAPLKAAAAIGFVWLLCVPPGTPPKSSAPLSTWIASPGGASASECSTKMVALLIAAGKGGDKNDKIRAEHAKCVEVQDPNHCAAP